MINTGGQAATQQERPNPARESVIEKALRYLDNMADSDIMITDPVEKKTKIRAVTSTLFKVISNILQSPFEPKFRKMPRNSNTVRDKIMAHPNAVNFLKLGGFKFDEPGEHIVLVAYSKEELEDCLSALKIFVERLGGAIKDPLAFDPFKAGVTSTTGQAAVPHDATRSGHDKISRQQSQIA